MLTTIRTFFAQRAIIEVETPLLCRATGTDPQLDFFSSYYHPNADTKKPNDHEMFLQTSPEFAMKRLLAAGSGSIYQICKAFRNGETGRLHNPEFSILEWYRVDLNLEQLMDETAELINVLLPDTYPLNTIRKISYLEIFEQVTGLNPLHFCQQKYTQYALDNAIEDAISICEKDHSMWLDFIFSYKVQPTLNDPSLYLIYGYPTIQSSLARINTENPAISERFEVFMQGIEIGNGFFELADPKEQEQRFDQENKARLLKNWKPIKKDHLFLEALKSGLPYCSGIALGLDRLLLIMANLDSLQNVLAFPFDRA